ncbi:MAG: 50S ribosomal protein L4 [Candidatus Pacebacteria bacterium]|nr:50S ribosomal protein L4 [Candidatus Paceibacterota bacterium]
MSKKLEVSVYAADGKEASTVALPEAVFGASWNADLVHEVVVAQQSNARGGNAHTKDRSEVRGGGKKPWRQKGTGRARHGSRRSPIWTGGGVTFGPRNEKDYSKKTNANARAKALASVLSKKHTDGEVIFMSELTFSEPKTAEAKKVLSALESVKEGIASKKNNAVLIALTARDEAVEKSFRNFGNVHVTQVKDMNVVDLLTYKYVVVAKPADALEVLERRVATKQARKAMTANT